MTILVRCVRSAVAVIAALSVVMIGAALICFGVPLGYGIAGDLAAAAGPYALALASEAAAAALLWRLWRRADPDPVEA